MLSKSSWVTSWSCRSQVRCSSGKAIESVWRVVFAQIRWMELEESQPLDSCQVLARENSSQYAGCDNQGRRRSRIVQRNIERVVENRRSVVVIVMSRNSAIWRKASLKSVMRENQLKYIDSEGMRVITNSKYVAEQVKIDKGENVVMDEPKNWRIRKN